MIISKIGAIVFALVFLIGEGFCYAAEKEDAVLSSANNETFEISFRDYKFHYSEVIGDSETAWMKGVRFSYKNQDPKTKQYWQVRYDRTDHDTNYDGATQSGIPVKTITNNKIRNTELILANPMESSEGSYAYIGYGYHTWDRDITGTGGYLEKYSWSYIPVGYRHEYQIDSKWDGAVDVAVKFMLNGHMKASGLSPIDDFKVNLGSKPGIKIEAPFSYQMSSQWSIVLTPWYEYSAIKQSNAVPLTNGGVSTGYWAVEPDSKANQYGIDIGIGYKF